MLSGRRVRRNSFRRNIGNFLLPIFTAVVLSGPLTSGADPVEFVIGDVKILSLAFSHDGKQLAAGTGGSGATVKVFDVASKKELFSLPLKARGAAFSVAFDHQGKQLAIADDNLAVSVRTSSDGTEIVSLPGDPERKKYRQARRLSFLPDGKRIAVGYSTGEVFVWDIATKSITARIDHRNEITAIAVSRDGLSIATGTDFGLRLWNSTTGESIWTLDRKGSGEHQVTSIAFTLDGKSIVTSDSPGFVKLFEVASGQELHSFKMPSVGAQTTIYGLGLTSDGQSIVVPGLLARLDAKLPTSLSTGLIILDVSSATPRAFIPSGPCRFFALASDSRSAAIATGDTGDPAIVIDLSNPIKIKP